MESVCVDRKIKLKYVKLKDYAEGIPLGQDYLIKNLPTASSLLSTKIFQ